MSPGLGHQSPPGSGGVAPQGDFLSASVMNATPQLIRGALASPPRRQAPVVGQRASVLAALFPGPDGAPHVWLVRRGKHLRAHAGQVALPGGKLEDGEEAIGAALREAEEEIALPRSSVEVLGATDDIVTMTGFHITPIVGWIEPSFVPTPNPEELDRVFSTPLHSFLPQGASRRIWIPPGLRRAFARREVDGEIVWGATLQVLEGLALRALTHHS